MAAIPVLFCCVSLLSVPPPETIDQAPVVAPPPTLAPDSVMADGEADWQAVFGPPAVAVAAAITVIVLSEVAAVHGLVKFEVSLSITSPE